MKKLLVVITTLTLCSPVVATECVTNSQIEADQVTLNNSMRKMLFNELADSINKPKTSLEKANNEDRIKSIEEMSTLPEKCYKNGSIVELRLLNNYAST